MNGCTRIALAALVLAGSIQVSAQGSPDQQVATQPRGQACSVPPFTELYANEGFAQWTADAEGCGLDSVLTIDLPGAAVAHYARRPDLGNLRLRFRVDLSVLTSLNLAQSVQLASGVAGASAPAGADATAQLFQITAIGNIPGTQTSLVFSAACAGQPNNRCTALSPLASLQPTIGLDWRSGPAGIGQLRWWIDADFDQAPTGSLALDNLAWGTLERLALGLASPSSGFMAFHAGRTVRFDRIEVLEDQLAWHDFESLDGGACALDPAPPLVFGPGTAGVSGSTCGGTFNLTTLASGSTQAQTPERNFRVEITGVGAAQSPRPLFIHLNPGSDPAVRAFLCERACSPSARCHLVAGMGSVFGTFDPGEYRLVLKALAAPSGYCGSWNLTINSVPK